MRSPSVSNIQSSTNSSEQGLPAVIYAAWSLLTLLVVITLLLAVVPRSRHLQADPYSFGDGYTSLGITVDHFAIYFTAIEVVFALLYFSVGLFIFWRAYRDGMAVLVSAAFIAMSASTPLSDALTVANPAWHWPVLLIRVSSIGLILFFLYLFPDGRFVPPWFRWIGGITALYLASWFAFPDVVPPVAILVDITNLAGLRLLSPLAVLLLIGIGGQIYRYLNISNPVQRQQAKWVMAGPIGFFVLEIVSLFIFGLTLSRAQPEADRLLFVIIFGPIILAGAALIPITTAFAILRLRLWDINFVVRRTAAYGLLTTALILIYLVSVSLLQGLFTSATGQGSAAAIVMSTLLIAAIFNPLRHRVQDLIDRRFHRRRYNSERLMEEFARVTRDEVNLERLESALLSIIGEAMEPERSSIWLRNIERQTADRRRTGPSP